MKGIISGIKRMEIHDGEGIRTTVFFKGCPLKCIWCHNPESLAFDKQIAYFEHKCVGCGACSGKRNIDTAKLCPVGAIYEYGTEYEAIELAEMLSKDRPFFEMSGGGVTFSGGECLAQPDFAVELARMLHRDGISVYIDTSGYVKREVLEKIAPYTDKFLFDIKAVNNSLHKKLTGRDNGLILDNLRFLVQLGEAIEVRYPLVMGYNDCECAEIGALLASLGGVSCVKVLKYHHFSRSRYTALGLLDTMPHTETTPEDVDRAVAILKGFGLNAVSGADNG